MTRCHIRAEEAYGGEGELAERQAAHIRAELAHGPFGQLCTAIAQAPPLSLDVSYTLAHRAGPKVPALVALSAPPDVSRRKRPGAPLRSGRGR